MNIAALIVAAGSGQRLGGLPKQYRPLAGEPVLRRTVRAFLDHPAVHGVLVAIDAGHRQLHDAALAGLGLPAPVIGGASRQETVRLGLEALASAPVPPDAVLIHDAARPLVSAALIGRACDALANAVAVLPALPVVDSLKRAEDGRVTGEAARDGLVRAQTPQGFHLPAILAAHRRFAGAALGDDTAVAAMAGIEVRLVEGEESNLKITWPADLDAAERHLAAGRPPPRWRTGQGFDVHRLVADRRLVLGGIEIAHELGLEGHSDADVVLHAITDALLGTIAAGDIGMHFPPSDPRWKDASSDRFLAHALELVRAAGGAIELIDVTILCERPKIGPHRDRMRQRIADILAIEAGRVSVKATTTEGLGFTGRSEGIAAQAVATVRLDG